MIAPKVAAQGLPPALGVMPMRRRFVLPFTALALASLAMPAAQAAPAPSTAISHALADPARSATNRALDESRKPAEILAFAGFKPGQVVADWASGTYQITFKAAQRGNQPSPNQDFQELIDGTAVGTFHPSGKSYGSYSTSTFVISGGGPHTITFQGLDSAGGDNTAFIDDVELEEADG